MSGVDIERLLTEGPTKQELTETLVAVCKQLEKAIKINEWHWTADEPPSEIDADEDGNVWALDDNFYMYRAYKGTVVAAHPGRYPVWCRTPGHAPDDILQKI